MERILEVTSNTIKKIDTSNKNNKGTSTFYRISLAHRSDRYDTGISLPIFKGGTNPRIRASSSLSGEDAVSKLLDRIKNALIDGINQNLVNQSTLFYIFDNISASIQILDIPISSIMTKFHNIVSCIYGYLNTHIVAPVAPQVINSVLPNNQIQNTNLYVSDVNKQIQPSTSLSEILSFKEVAIRWFQHKNTFTIKTKDNPNPLSPKTLQGYNKIMNLILIPYFESYNSVDIISNEMLQKCIDDTNGYRQKEAVYLTLKMIMDYARENNYISSLKTLKKPPKQKRNSKLKIEGHDFIYIESSRQSHWLECFEDDAMDSSYLFEGMLLEGFRPEEACGLCWTSLVEDNNYFIVNNAFKDFPVYNEFAEVIGHVRQYDTLKTDESYRKIPVHPRYKEILLQHKEKQKMIFKKFKLKWTEDTPIFLNRYHQPYIPENLAKCLTKFRKKYDLEYLTPYGLRHSFATFMSEQGMRDIVLMKLMGHADFKTTQKYYIFVSDERKKLEYEQAWGLGKQLNDNANTTTNNNNNVAISNESTQLNDLMIEQFNQLQKMWMNILVASTLSQKNNTI